MKNRARILKIFLILSGSFLFVHAPSATVINIPADYPTIQQGIDASADGDTVLVQPGTYYENINFNGHNITLASLFLTTGDESYIVSTVVNGDSSGAVFTLSNFENSSTVITGFKIVRGGGVQGGGIICDGADPLITRNYIIENYGESGGGIYCILAYPVISDNVFTANISSGIGCYSSWPKITNNTFMGNFAEMGGAIYCENSPDAVISGNYISRNYDIGDGAGIYCNMSDATITGNLITENIAGRGGGIFCQQSSPMLRGNTISMNLAETNGGGIYLFQSDPVIANNVIANNMSDSYGAGLFCNHSNPSFINNTVTRNTANTGGGGVYNFYSIPVITNCIFWANGAPAGPEIFNYSNSSAVTYSDIQGGWAGEGNIDIDPLFKYPAGGDYHLMVPNCGDTLDSPCIDAGDPNILDSLLDCSWGLGGPRSDMGAYGGGDSVTVGIWGGNSPLPERYMLMENYPNPFNTATLIEFDLMHDCYVTIDIIDILGRQTAELVNEYRPAGRNFARWDASNQASGIYFCRLEGCGFKVIRRMVLVR
jgi:predicted outer membrane repeat protein